MVQEESFRVHLDSLLQFARELEIQLDAMRKPIDDLSTLEGGHVPFGAFAEAGSLAMRHRAAAEQMRDLLETVRQAIAFADDVTRMIADGYAKHDSGVATSFYV